MGPEKNAGGRMMGRFASTTTICISKSTYEAWKSGEKKVVDFNTTERTYREADFVDNRGHKNIVNSHREDECPDDRILRKRIDMVNDTNIKADLPHVYERYKKTGEGWNPEYRDGSYVSFLRYYLFSSEFIIARKYAKEEYIDPEEWEFMKDSDEHDIVRQNPYMEVEDDGKNVRITMWGA